MPMTSILDARVATVFQSRYEGDLDLAGVGKLLGEAAGVSRMTAHKWVSLSP
jgi:hypothetical protein